MTPLVAQCSSPRPPDANKRVRPFPLGSRTRRPLRLDRGQKRYGRTGGLARGAGLDHALRAAESEIAPVATLAHEVTNGEDVLEVRGAKREGVYISAGNLSREPWLRRAQRRPILGGKLRDADPGEHGVHVRDRHSRGRGDLEADRFARSVVVHPEPRPTVLGAR